MSKSFSITMESIARHQVRPFKMRASPSREGNVEAMECLSPSVIAAGIDGEIAVVKDNLDRADVAADLLEVAASLEQPTETELRLMDIMQFRSAPTDELEMLGTSMAIESLSLEKYKDQITTMEMRLVVAQESIGSAIADIWTAFKSFLSKIAFNLRSYQGQLGKLRSILLNVKTRSSKTSISVELKANSLMFTGKDENYSLKPVTTTKEMADGLTEFCKHFDKFTNAYALALYNYSGRYASAFLALFQSGASEDLFFEELKRFSESFFEKVIEEGELTIGERKGLVVLNRSKVGIGGTYFGVTSPSDQIYKNGDINSVLRSFGEYEISCETVRFDANAGGKTKVLTVDLADIEQMLTMLDLSINALNSLTTDRLLDNIHDLEDFVDFSVPTAIHDEATGYQTTASKIEQAAAVAKIAFKKTNAVARLQVMQANVAIDAYKSIYNGLTDKLDDTVTLCYEALNKRDWFEQDLGL